MIKQPDFNGDKKNWKYEKLRIDHNISVSPNNISGKVNIFEIYIIYWIKFNSQKGMRNNLKDGWLWSQPRGHRDQDNEVKTRYH